ncbi:hypothetical protein V1264_000600 [Littorina saxatilis]|uniref:Uncharacterized protein n=1 Tax=Littorina saxatilis TaxID=31220 RepID=A0AAN9GNQ4_9CAEN
MADNAKKRHTFKQVAAESSPSPSATVTHADVHASQDADDRHFLSLSGPSSGVPLHSKGMSATQVTGFSGQSVARSQEEVAPFVSRGGESSDLWAGQFRTGGRSVQGKDPEKRTEVLVHPALSQDFGQGVQLPLPPWGQEEGSKAVSQLNYDSQCGGQLPDCTDVHDGCTDDGASGMGECTEFRLPQKLSNAVALAFKYFEEGVVESKAQVVPPPSALGDFRSSKEARCPFFFGESPSVAFVMVKVLSGSRHQLNTQSSTVPLLSQHGEAPESAKPWLAQADQQAPSCSANLRNFKLSTQPISLIESFALLKAALPVTPELATLREDGYSRDRPVPCTEASLLALEETGRSLLELASLSESLQRSLSRSIATSLDPFEFRYDASSEDVTTLLATLARVSQEQMNLSARLYTHAVYIPADRLS